MYINDDLQHQFEIIIEKKKKFSFDIETFELTHLLFEAIKNIENVRQTGDWVL